MLDLARGDIGMSRHLRQVLNILADSGVDKNLEKQFREIAKGNGSLRDLLYSESFMRLGDPVIAQAKEDMAAQTPEEKQRLAEQGEAILERYRHEDPNVPVPEEPPAARPSTVPEPPADPAPAHNATAQPARSRRQSWRDIVVTPDEPDEDDLYFQERHRNGWLQ